MSRARSWCFTLNNYTQADVDRLLNLGNAVGYLLFGREVSGPPNNTPHLQGFVQFDERKRMNQVIAIIGQCHLTVCRNVNASIEYCKKDGNFESIGVPPATGQGTRNDMEAFKDAVKGGVLSLNEIRESHSDVYARHPRFVHEYMQQHAPVTPMEMHPLRQWQQELNVKLNGAANSRTIIFVVDPIGNSGKSWFAHYYASLHPDVQVMLPSKKADMTYALDSTLRVLFIDAPRSKQGEFIQYDFLEDCKNGYVFSPKYESRHKRLQKCHVVVLMNENPDMAKLSLDRYDIINI